MPKKPNDEPEVRVNGDGELLQSIANSLTLLNDRIDDIEDRVTQGSAKNQAALVLVNHCYNTDKDHIKELSNITPLSCRMLAIASTADKIGSPEVKSGEVSLIALRIDNYLRYRRSASGRWMLLAQNALQEQVSAQTEKEGEEFEAGKE